MDNDIPADGVFNEPEAEKSIWAICPNNQNNSIGLISPNNFQT